jgi:hypothetical protein
MIENSNHIHIRNFATKTGAGTHASAGVMEGFQSARQPDLASYQAFSVL